MRKCEIYGCDLKHKAKGFCTKHYSRMERCGSPHRTKIATNDYTTTFLNIVCNSHSDQCINWPFGKSGSKEYPTITYGGKVMSVSRACLLKTVGPPPTENHVAAHTPIICHNPSCVNPKHLRWATEKENWDDRRLDGTDIFAFGYNKSGKIKHLSPP